MTTQILLPLSLALIMFSMGLTLMVDDFRRVFSHPLAMAFGLFSQLLLLPAIAFALAALLSLSPGIAVGLLILAACPGGITSNLLTHIARGDTALSVSLTAVTSLAGVIWAPVVVNLGLAWFTGATEMVPLPLEKMVIGIFLISTLPLLLGMTMRAYCAQWAEWLEAKTKRLAIFVFLLIVVATFLGHWGNIADHFSGAGVAVVALNIITMTLAFLGARLLRLDHRQGVAITLECGLQNAAMGIFIAATLLADTTMVIPSLIYALVMNISAAFVIVVNIRPIRELLYSR